MVTLDEKIEEWLRRGFLEDRRSQALIRARRAAGPGRRSVLDDKIEQILGSNVAGLEAADERGEIPHFLPARHLEPGLRLGTDHRGNQVTLAPETLAHGLLLLGAARAGKTVMLLNLLSELASRGVSFWAVDLYKSDLRCLLERIPSMVVLTAETLLVNPLQPAGKRVNVHVTADAISRALGLGGRARTIIAAALEDLYGRFGNSTGKTDAYPVLHDIYEWVRRRSDLNAQARLSIDSRPFFATSRPFAAAGAHKNSAACASSSRFTPARWCDSSCCFPSSLAVCTTAWHTKQQPRAPGRFRRRLAHARQPENRHRRLGARRDRFRH